VTQEELINELRRLYFDEYKDPGFNHYDWFVHVRDLLEAYFEGQRTL